MSSVTDTKLDYHKGFAKMASGMRTEERYMDLVARGSLMIQKGEQIQII